MPAKERAIHSTLAAHRRLANPAFQARLHRVRAQMVERTAGMLTAAAGEAVKTLLALPKTRSPPRPGWRRRGRFWSWA
jgi:hypothetical protein